MPDRESRRDFLRQSAAFSLMPLCLFSVGNMFDHQRSLATEAKRLHDKVLAAFDFGAGLLSQDYTMTATGFVGTRVEFPWNLVILQNRMPELKRGREYAIVTELSITKGRERIAVHVGRNGPDVLGPSEFYADPFGYRCCRLVARRHL